MMVICGKHAGQPAMQVSRDVVNTDGQVSADLQLVTVDYEYEGMCACRFYLSPATASRLGFTKPTVLPLPDEYPSWVNDVPWSFVCAKCFAESRR
jgi:hypothetical protein